ncbi:MAG: hypothetical protein ABSH10_07655 [Phycisphaerae bacterium]|jgi:hypothetical protein
MSKSNKKAASLPVAAAAVAEAPRPESRWLGATWLLIALLVAAISIGTIWAEPRPIGDLFVALAVGRDAMNGKLGKPDDWAFTTEGRVAINQNWGSHLLHYWVYEATGPTGLLVLKMALIAAAALFICLAARQRGVGWPVALVVAAGAIATGRAYIDLRANLTTLTLAPLVLWLLFKTRQNVHWIWPVMILNGFWANAHGGFIFGLGMTGLWAAMLCIQRTILLLRTGRPASAALKQALTELWPLPVATIGSVALAGFVNPYGLTNLTFPFTILAPAWLKLNEWQPLIANVAFGSTWGLGTTGEYFVVLGVLAVLLLFRVAGIPGVPASHLRRPNVQEVCETSFDLILTAVVVYMAFKARRFVPLSAIVLAPFLAIQLQWFVDWLDGWRRLIGKAVLVAGAVAMAVPLLIHAYWLWLYYNPNNPRVATQSVFDRMSGVSVQPVGAGQFLADNHVSGRVFNEWRWEGYLHWICPSVKVFLGGRAHMVYDPATDDLAGRILAGPTKFTPTPDKYLADLGVHLVVVPLDDGHTGLLWQLMERPGAAWAYIYFDGKDVVAADSAWPATAELIHRAADGELVYPNPATAAISRAMAIAAPCSNRPPTEAMEAFQAAIRIRPTFMAYNAVRQLALRIETPAWQKEYFQREYDRLEQMDYHVANGVAILRMRAQLADYLFTLYQADGDMAQALQWVKAKDQAAADFKALADRWP